MVNAFLITGDDIIIADPEGEYFPLVSRLGGQAIKLSPTSPHYLNPMDINVDYSDKAVYWKGYKNRTHKIYGKRLICSGFQRFCGKGGKPYHQQLNWLTGRYVHLVAMDGF